MSIKSNGGIFGRNPKLNNLELDGTLNVSGQSDFSSPVDISYTNSSRSDLLKLQNLNTGGYGPWLNFYAAYNGGYSFAKIGAENQGTGASLRFHTADTSGVSQERVLMDNAGNVSITDGNLVVASGHGIDFSATGDGSGTADSELFADYEEGTFTPVVEGTSSAGTATYPRQGGRYTKIGDRVFFVAALVYNSHTGTGNMRVSGLPYAIKNQDANRAFIPFYADNLSITGVPVAVFVLGQTYFNVNALENGSASALAMDAAATLYVTGSYEVA